MIYKSGYITKAVLRPNKEGMIGRIWILSLCLLIGVFVVGIHAIFLKADVSYLNQYFSFLVQPGCFSVGYTCGMIETAFLLVYIMVNYQTVTFREMNENRWYLLNKMGYRSVGICFGKMASLFLTLVFLYTGGFVVAMLISQLFQYQMIPGLIQTAYVIGLLELLGIASFLMLCSLWVGTRWEAVGYTFLYLAGNLMLRTLGYTELISDTEKMTDVRNLFDPNGSIYFILLAGAVLLLGLIPFLYARLVPVYYKPRNCSKQGEFVVDYRSDSMRFNMGLRLRSWPKPVTFTVGALLILVILSGIFLNLFMQTTESGTEIGNDSYFGVIPYLNRSDAPEAIGENDFAFFRDTRSGFPIQKGDIVLLREEDGIGVKQVLQVSGSTAGSVYAVSADGSLNSAEEVNRNSIYGILIKSFGWLGELALFSVTLQGRALMLLIPFGLLFLSSEIKRRPKKESHRC